MGDDKISGNEAIDAALRLDGDPQNVRQYYADWARHYDRDVGEAEYSGPLIAAQLLQQHLADRQARILDAGCGTGLVGVELQALGYGAIEGFDLSPEMAELSKASGAYRWVDGGVDMMLAAERYPHSQYDALLSIGVFTLGHVPPRALAVLLRLVCPGGLMLISTRSHYYEQTDYQQQVDALVDRGSMKLLRLLRDAPYNRDGDAHYWVFSKAG